MISNWVDRARVYLPLFGRVAGCFLLLFLNGCGEKIAGPGPFKVEKRAWWNIMGDRIPATSAAVTSAEGGRSLVNYVNLKKPRAELHLLIRDQMLSPEILREFTRKTGIGFKVSIYNRAQEVRDLVLKDAGQVDLSLVSYRLVEELIAAKELAPLDHSLLTHMADLEWPEPVGKFFTRDLPFDPENRFTIPFLVGSIGIVYNRNMVGEKVHSLKELLNPGGFSKRTRDNVRGHIVMLSDDRYAISAALLALGEDPNTTNRVILEHARELLLKQRPYLAGLGTTNSSGFERSRLAFRMASEEVALGQATAADASRAIKLEPNIEFVIPKEGAVMIMDCFVIPDGAAKRGKQKIAQEFLDYLMNPLVAGLFVNFSHYASTSDAAKAFVAPEVRNGPAYKIPVREQGHYFIHEVDPSSTAIYHQIFEELTRFSSAQQL